MAGCKSYRRKLAMLDWGYQRCLTEEDGSEIDSYSSALEQRRVVYKWRDEMGRSAR